LSALSWRNLREETLSFFESLIALVAAAVLLLQVSRRLRIPYPTMLAAAGVCFALIPGAPKISIEPHTALALFLAPVLVDAAFDVPINDVRKLWRPLFALVVVAVGLSAGMVTWLGVTMAGLPIAAALALGAIVAPPDAAAATAILTSVRMPRGSVAVLKGESLLNDASALLLFSAALAFQAQGSIDGALALRLTLAAPGGIILGILLAQVLRVASPLVTGTLGGNVFEFVVAFGSWLIAERLGLSPVLCLVAFAMTVARTASLRTPPRMRIHSFAVWTSAVFMLNVLAFLLMGLQARTIVTNLDQAKLMQAMSFAGAVVVCLIVVRLAWVLLYLSLAQRFPSLRGGYPAISLRNGVLVGWCGMRGLVTLATAFALPANFPQRDLVVLTAFAVVLATLVIQGLTLPLLVRLLKLDGENGLDDELVRLRADLAGVALTALEGKQGEAADHWRFRFAAVPTTVPEDCGPLEARRTIGLKALRRQRVRLDELRDGGAVGADAFLILQEELDFEEVSISREDERQIEES
jgi:NhaP-type Na+/H+ or K+/H+ antiporter